MTKHIDKQINDEAADWLVRLEDVERPLSAGQQAGFFSWLRRSPHHVQAFFETADLWRGLQGFDTGRQLDLEKLLASHSMSVSRLTATTGTPPQASAKPRYRSWQWPVAAAATLTCATVLTWQFIGDTRAYSTALGEQRILKLPDGSVLQLNTRSRAEVDYSSQARVIKLTQGEAMFTVEHDAVRPFIVQARGASIRALGTQFNVRERDNTISVAVVEGAVQVFQGRNQGERLTAGEEASVVRGRVTRQATANIAAAVAWKNRRLVFENASLAEVAAEFNRYNTVQIRAAEDVGQTRHITGIFSTDHPQSLILYLQKEPTLKVEQTGEAILVRGHPAIGQAERDPAPSSE